MRPVHSCLCCVVGLALAGCAGMNVTKVVPNAAQPVAGIRYSLPKPFIQVVPQSDGTIAVDVIYLPDSNNTYAIAATSTMSSYTFQVALDQSGMLNAVEFKQNTSAVGQQVAAGAGAAAAQIYNMKAAQVVATQTAVNSAQSSVDAARSARDAAQKQLDSDMQNNVTANINTDRAALAAAQAKFQDAQQVLDRSRSSAQFASVTATAGTPITTTVPTPGTTGFGPQTWSAPAVYDLPEQHGAVLFAVNEGVKPGGTPYVDLKAVKIEGMAQYDFKTTRLALGKPALGPQNAKTPAGGGPVQFTFTRAVAAIVSSSVTTTAVPPRTVLKEAKATLDSDRVTVVLPALNLPKGQYILEVNFTYDPDPQDPNQAEGPVPARVSFIVD